MSCAACGAAPGKRAWQASRSVYHTFRAADRATPRVVVDSAPLSVRLPSRFSFHHIQSSNPSPPYTRPARAPKVHRRPPAMLEQMRKSSRSLLIYVLFLIVIAVFIINFGPQSRGGSCESTMPGNDHYAAKVGGDVISTNDFRYGFLMLGGAQYPAQMAKQQRLKETVMDKLIEREILAQEAERLGYVVTEEEVEDLIADSKIIGL